MIAFWFRRDLRLADNMGLYKALCAGEKVIPIFIFDKNILNTLPKQDKRVNFIHQQTERLQQELIQLGSSLCVYYGEVMEAWKYFCEQYSIQSVFTNHDYEPYAKQREEEVTAFLASKQIPFQTFKDQVIFEKTEILNNSGLPYTVFTPYSKKWKAMLTPQHYQFLSTETHFEQFWQSAPLPLPTLSEMGFEKVAVEIPSLEVQDNILQTYHDTRNFPALPQGTSRLGLHLRFGTISIRKLVARALALNETYLNELIWREFYMQILWNFPHVVTQAFKPAYDNIEWENEETLFQKWCEGKTCFAFTPFLK